MMRLPKRIDLGQLRQFDVGHVLLSREHSGEGERLLTFVLPPFQRPPVWTRKQSIRFMESLILGLPIGTYTYCSAVDRGTTDGWLIDGQQRMRAIASFIAGKFPVFGYRWPELTIGEHRRIQNTGFAAYVLPDASEDECLEQYLRMNYGGTPHTAADRSKAKRFVPATAKGDE